MDELEVEVALLRRRVERERSARLEAEAIAERATRALWEHNVELERRVEERTRQLDEARQVAVSAGAAKDRMLANLAHELRTPLAVILAACEEVDSVGVGISPELAELAVAAHRSAQDLGRAFDQLFRLAGLDRLPLASVPPAVNVAAALEAFCGRWARRAATKGLLLAADIDPVLAGPLRIEIDLLLEALDEVVDNSVKFTPRGSIEVIAQLDPITPVVVVTVIDQGIGIAPADRTRVLEAFTQVDGGSDRHRGGLGLGLTVASGLVDALGGVLEFGDTPDGRGLAVSIAVPCHPEPTGQAVVPRPVGRYLLDGSADAGA